MNIRKIAALFGAMMAGIGSMRSGDDRLVLKSRDDMDAHTGPLPINVQSYRPSRPNTSNSSVARDRRSARKRRNIQKQKRHPNCRSGRR